MGTRMTEDDDQIEIAALLRSMPPPDVSADFVARVNARIDETQGWFGLADFRVWTLRLAPAAAVLALVAILWPGRVTTGTSGVASTIAPTTESFSPASAADWQQDVSANDLLAAALQASPGGSRVR